MISLFMRNCVFSVFRLSEIGESIRLPVVDSVSFVGILVFEVFNDEAASQGILTTPAYE